MRILLIEDEPSIARTVSRALRKAGFAVDVAVDGEAGLALGRDFPFDLVLLDLLLPKLHGLSVLKELRRLKPALPILVLSALDQLEEKVDGLDKGADDYLTKPFRIEEVLARVRALLRRGKADVVGSVIEVGDLRIDLARRTVARGGVPVQLTLREYAILVHLASNRGKVVTRSEIGEHVIDRGFVESSNMISVSMSGLRAKLGSPPLIHTVRGVGYRLDDPEAR